MPHALEIPEILLHLAPFLKGHPPHTKHHLTICALVCKTWNHIFSPLLYHNCSLAEGDEYNIKNPSLETLIKHADSIRELAYKCCTNPNIFKLECFKLTSLDIESEFTNEPQSEISALVPQLIRKSSNTLKIFKITGDNDSGLSSNDLWRALAECPSIDHIEVYRIYSEDMDAFWEVASKVEILHLVRSDISFGSDIPNAPTQSARFPRLKHLRMHLRNQDYEIAILKNAPNLGRLSWDIFGAAVIPRNIFRQVMTELRLPKLQGLRFGHELDDEDVALALDAMTDADYLEFSWSYFSHLARRSLISRHAATIQTLIITCRDDITHCEVHDILTDCPSLVTLITGRIYGPSLIQVNKFKADGAEGSGVTEEVVLGKDWVCLGLRHLSLYFEPNGYASKAVQRLEQEHLFRQLSRLTQLESLVLLADEEGDSYIPDLRLESSGGNLDKLTSLKRLETFSFQCTNQMLRKEEIHWMVEHWPSLKSVKGVFQTNDQYDKTLEVYLKEQLDKRKDLN
ncbi:hypothetical protein BGX26_003732 [Mortierella sp. AD094]|nr:hypothetical protein BGX26_003732 [Mortierella sp. AD094]